MRRRDPLSPTGFPLSASHSCGLETVPGGSAVARAPRPRFSAVCSSMNPAPYRYVETSIARTPLISSAQPVDTNNGIGRHLEDRKVRRCRNPVQSTTLSRRVVCDDRRVGCDR